MGGGPPQYHPHHTSESPGSPSSRSSGSMVSITAPTLPPPQARLLFSKSHVYVHPTSLAKDNVCGFAAIVDQLDPRKIFLSWIPDSLARGRTDYDTFLKADRRESARDLSNSEGVLPEDDFVLVAPIPERSESYAFSVSLGQVYSIIVYPPSLSKWYGSLTINLIGGQTLPTLHFHDDESPSTISLLAAPRSSNPHPPAWGGEDFLQKLRSYATLLRSSIEPNLFLVDPSRGDAELHSTPIFDDNAVEDILSPVPANRRPIPNSNSPADYSSVAACASSSSSSHTYPHPTVVHAPRTTLLSTFSQITRAATSLSSSILSHPSISPHLPQPVRSLIHADAPQFARWSSAAGTGEFESARVYLARWARLVAEEGERAKRAEISGVEGVRTEGTGGELGVWEVLRVTNGLGEERSTRETGRPIGRVEWEDWWDERGWPLVEEEHMRGEVFRRGIDESLRATAWPFLLGVVPWKSTAAERAELWERKSKMYHQLRTTQTLDPDVRAKPEIVEEIHRIDVDCRRTDRTQAMFAIPTTPGETDAAAEDDDGGKTASNEHVDKLAEILLTYVLFERDLGYVQGMSDLMAPLYVILNGDEVSVFWCFVEFMERMKPNFLRDQSGMKQQLLTLQQLIAGMDPELYRHLGDLFRLFDHILAVSLSPSPEKTESLNLFFCFRWILIAFKREFEFNEVIPLWENLFTNYYTSQFVLFVALAVLHSHRDVMLRYLTEFDEILKYSNDLSGCIQLDSTLAQAEVLFLSFRSLVRDVDRRQAIRDQAAGRTSEAEGLHRRKAEGGEFNAMTMAAPAAVTDADGLEIPNLPLISDNLRALLD